MDPITALALSIHSPIIFAMGNMLDNNMFYIAVILSIIFFAERKNDKRLKIILSLGVALILGLIVKSIVAEPRPCMGVDWCPLDYAFPSNHTVIAFTLLLSFVKKKSFPIFIIFALFVAFTRLNLGVHSFGDILGAAPIALVAYYAVEAAWAKFGEEFFDLFKKFQK